MPDTCPDCGAIQWGNATCATCRSHWPDEPDCHEGNVGANIAGGRYSSAAWIRTAFYGAQVLFGVGVGASFFYLLWWLV